MKKMALWVSGILLGLYLAWVVVIAYSSTHKVIWNAQSRGFLDNALIPVLNDPSVFAFHALADQRWRRDLNRDGKPLMRTLTRLGPLQAFRVRGGVQIAWFHDFTIAAHYHMRARFRRGTALFQIVLVKRRRSWRISQLRIIRDARPS